MDSTWAKILAYPLLPSNAAVFSVHDFSFLGINLQLEAINSFSKITAFMNLGNMTGISTGHTLIIYINIPYNAS
jgi:hypothetical protein